MTNKLTFTEYTDIVLEYLEYMGFDDYIMGFDAEDIAHRIYMGNVIAYDAFHISPRMCAIFHMGALFNQMVKLSVNEKRH